MNKINKKQIKEGYNLNIAEVKSRRRDRTNTSSSCRNEFHPSEQQFDLVKVC